MFKWSDIRDLQQHMAVEEVFTYLAIKFAAQQLGEAPRKVDITKLAGPKMRPILGKMRKKGWFPDYDPNKRRYDLTALDAMLASGELPTGPTRRAFTHKDKGVSLRRLVAQRDAKAAVELLRDHLIRSGCDNSVFTFRWILRERAIATSHILDGIPLERLRTCLDWIFSDPGASYLAPHCTSIRKVVDYLPKYMMRGRKANAGQGFIGDTNKHDEIWGDATK